MGLVGARNDEAGQLAAGELFAERGEPGRQCDARFWLLKFLEVRFEHVDHFRIMGIGPQCRRI